MEVYEGDGRLIGGPRPDGMVLFRQLEFRATVYHANDEVNDIGFY